MTRNASARKRPGSAAHPLGLTLRSGCVALAAVGLLCYGIDRAQEADFIPLPKDILPETTKVDNPIMDLAEATIIRTGHVSFSPKIPESFVIRNNNGNVFYDNENRRLVYTGGSSEDTRRPLYLRTDEGYEIFAEKITADFATREAQLEGPLLIYQGETMTRAESGTYNWEHGEADVRGVRAKVGGLLVRGSRMEYKKDEKGENYLVIHDTYVSAEDVEKPGMWLGAGKLTVHPGDYGSLSHLSVASGDYDMTVPLLGWFTISHSLNPEEGYLPIPGSEGIWGTYLRNRYGVLIGNRRVEHGMPVADFTATALLDYRSRRGDGGGFELVDERMHRKFQDTTGLAVYYAADRQPDINPTRFARDEISKDRYRVALQAIQPFTIPPDSEANWQLSVTGTIVSDQYMLRDFFRDISQTDDKPDNALWISRRTRADET